MKTGAKKKAKHIILIFVIMVSILVGTVTIMLFRMSASMGAGSAPVADYDKRIEIWNHVPGSSNEKKLDHMNVNENRSASVMHG